MPKTRTGVKRWIEKTRKNVDRFDTTTIILEAASQQLSFRRIRDGGEEKRPRDEMYQIRSISRPTISSWFPSRSYDTSWLKGREEGNYLVDGARHTWSEEYSARALGQKVNRSLGSDFSFFQVSSRLGGAAQSIGQLVLLTWSKYFHSGSDWGGRERAATTGARWEGYSQRSTVILLRFIIPLHTHTYTQGQDHGYVQITYYLFPPGMKTKKSVFVSLCARCHFFFFYLSQAQFFSLAAIHWVSFRWLLMMIVLWSEEGEFFSHCVPPLNSQRGAHFSMTSICTKCE